MDPVMIGSLTLTPTRTAFSPPPPAGLGGLILRCLAQKYGATSDPGQIFRSATGHTLAALVSQEGAARARATALLQAGVDAVRVCWVLDRAGGDLQAHVDVRALRADGRWFGLDAQPLGDADLVFLPTLYASTCLRDHYPLLPEAHPTAWYGLGLALNRARYRPPLPRHPRLIVGVDRKSVV